MSIVKEEMCGQSVDQIVKQESVQQSTTSTLVQTLRDKLKKCLNNQRQVQVNRKEEYAARMREWWAKTSVDHFRSRGFRSRDHKKHVSAEERRAMAAQIHELYAEMIVEKNETYGALNQNICRAST